MCIVLVGCMPRSDIVKHNLKLEDRQNAMLAFIIFVYRYFVTRFVSA